MYGVTSIALLALGAAQTVAEQPLLSSYVSSVEEAHASMQQLVENLINELLDRKLVVSALRKADLDNATLGELGHVTLSRKDLLHSSHLAPVLATPYRSALQNRRSSSERAVAQALPELQAILTSQPGVGVGVNTALALGGAAKGVYKKMLTPSGLLHAWALGVILWSSFGWQGWTLGVFQLLATSRVTKVKMKDKEALGIAEGRGGQRGPENIWGAGGTAALCALGALHWPMHATLLRLGFVSSLATKLSDSFQSEIGKAYGKNCFLITNLKPVPRGTEGAVSVEGTLAGVVGSLIIAAYASLVGLVGRDPRTFLLVAAAAFVGTTVESYIGAILQNKSQYLTNEVVNFINTLVGAAFAMGVGGRFWNVAIH